MNLTNIVEEQAIDPKEVAEVLTKHAMQMLDKNASEEDISEYLTNFAIARIAELQLVPVGEILREKDIGLCLWNFAAEQIKHSRLLKTLNDAFCEIESHDVCVQAVYMPEEDYKTLKAHIGNSFDPSCRREFLERGIEGWLWTAEVRIDKNATETTVIGEEIV